MKIFMLDNYDSFTYNLVQYFQILGCDVTARRCDCTTVDAVFALRPDAIVLSPGPGRPDSAGILPVSYTHLRGALRLYGAPSAGRPVFDAAPRNGSA